MHAHEHFHSLFRGLHVCAPAPTIKLRVDGVWLYVLLASAMLSVCYGLCSFFVVHIYNICTCLYDLVLLYSQHVIRKHFFRSNFAESHQRNANDHVINYC